MAFGYDGSIRIKADLNHSNFDRGLASMTGKVQSFGKTLMKIAGLVSLAFGTAALINFGKESIKLASDIQEVQNVIDVTFGKGSAQIEEFSQTAAEAFGLSELSAKRYTGTMGAMLKSSGLATSQAQEMSVALAGLAGDLASFYNLDTDAAFEKIRSGISGETEPLKQLGINMSVANLEAYALSKGITKSYNAMSQAEQVLLRYNYLLSVTTDAQGDFARTSGSFANQIRILQLNFDQLRIAVGNALIPIAQAVLPSINAIIAGLTKLARVFAQVTALLFGKSAEVKATSGVAVSASAAADATNDLADATAGAGGAAKQAAKDMKGVLAGFDELNVIASRATDSVGGAGAGIGGAGSDLEIPSYESEIEDANQLEEAFSSLGELFVKALDDMLAAMPGFKQNLLDFADSFNEFNRKLYEALTFTGAKERVQQLGAELADAFNALASAIDWELWGRKLGAGLNLGLQFLVNFLYEFDWINLGNKLAEFVNGIIYEVDWEDFGRLLWAKFKLALETFAGFIAGLDMPALAQAASDIVIGFFNSMQETLANIDWAEIGRQVADFLNNVDWVGVIGAISGALGEMVNAGIEAVGGFISEADPGTLLIAAGFLASKLMGDIVKTVVAPLAKELVGKIIENIASGLAGSGFSGIVTTIGDIVGKIGPVIAGISAATGGAFLAVSNFVTMLTDGFSWLNEALMLVGIAIAAVGAVILGVPATVAAAIAGIVAAIATAVVVIKEHWTEIIEFFSKLWEDIATWAVEAWDNICEYWSGVGEWWSENVITPITEFFTQLGEDIATWATETWNSIVSVWQAVSGWFNENVIQPVTGFFSNMWDGITKFAKDTWDNIVNAFKDAGKWFEDYVTGPIGRAFEAVGEFVKGAINGIIGTVEGMVNAVIRAVNWLISQLNKLRIDIPDWVPAIGGKSFGFNIPKVSEVKLPRLANGAVIPPNQQFAAILGDQRSGKNLEAPAGLIRQMVADGMREALAQNGSFGRGGNMTIIMEIDGREFGRASYKYGTAEQQRVGVRLAEVRT